MEEDPRPTRAENHGLASCRGVHRLEVDQREPCGLAREAEPPSRPRGIPFAQELEGNAAAAAVAALLPRAAGLDDAGDVEPEQRLRIHPDRAVRGEDHDPLLLTGERGE